MDPIKRFVVAAVGALIGAIIAAPRSLLLDALIGALAGFGAGEIAAHRAQLAALSAEIRRLRNQLERIPVTEPKTAAHLAAPAAAAAAPVAPAPFAPTHRPVSAAAETAALRTPAPSDAPGAAPQSPLFAALRGFVTGGNTLVRAGIIVLFFGVAFLLRYMAEHTRVPVEIRLTGVALGGLALLASGWRLRASRPGYALALQGGGVGILYLTVFAALRLYAILPAGVAFAILALVAVLSAALAVLQNSMSFAMLGIIGGFLAPVLASTGQGSHIVLFSYYAVLNAGILAVSWFKSWRPLNITGFVFTFAIGTGWGVLKYRPEEFASTEPFLALFFLFYLGISILFTRNLPAKLIGYVDGTLIFGTPIVVFALQSAMLQARPMALAYSAVAMSAVYLACAWLLARLRHERRGLLLETCIALGLAFLTLAVPLALDARWNAAAWALEGAALIWLGCRQQRVLPRVAGALLSLASGWILCNEFNLSGKQPLLPWNSYFGVLTEAAAAAFAAGTLHTHRGQLKQFELATPGLLFAWGLGWWLIGGFAEIAAHVPVLASSASLSFTTLTALLCSAYHRRVGLGAAQIAALLQLPAMLLFFAAAAFGHGGHPFANGGWWAWPAAFTGLYYLMFRHEGPARAARATLLHAAALWLLAALASWEAAWAINKAVGGSSSWPLAAWGVLPALLLLLSPMLVMRVSWPFARNREAYLVVAGLGTALYLALWSLGINFTSHGDSTPLPYYPLLNPLDLGEAFVLIVLYRHWRVLETTCTEGIAAIDRRLPMAALCALSFLWLNAVLLRTLNQWFAVPLDLNGVLQSTLCQTSLSIFWAILALATMVFATRRNQRTAWLTGASLLALTVAKLFLVDLSRIGSIERIVSFLGVGMLMLIVGYLSPIPPAPEAPR